jgi:CRP-like cAMP-binding protein
MTDNLARLQAMFLHDSSLRQAMEPFQLADGQILFQRGDPGDSLYLIEQGRVRIYTQDPQGQEITLNHLDAGHFIGELALIDALPRSASVVAIGPVQLLCLSREAFLQHVHGSPQLTQQLIALLTERVRYMTQYVERLGQWARLIADEDYSQMSDSLTELDFKNDSILAAVADSVRLMVQAIQEREQELKTALTQLQINIDEKRRKTEVEEITETDYFQSLVQQSRQRRRTRPKFPD